MATNDLVASVQGSAAKPYEIRETADPSVLWCSCPAWKHNKETPKSCKHIKSLGRTGPPASSTVTPSRTATVAAVSGPTPAGGVKPMRLETVAPMDAQPLFESDEWVCEQKVDGTRCVVTVHSDGRREFTASNGQPLKHATSLLWTEKLGKALPSDLHGTYALDGELLWTGEFWVFDVVRFPDETVQTAPLQARRAILEMLFDVLKLEAPVFLLPQAVGLEAKLNLLRTVEAAGGEGVVLKRLDAPYVPGTRAITQLKLKFTKTVDCVVTARNTNGKTNAELAVHATGSPSGCRHKLVNVGSCSMLGKPDAQVGDVVEVKYLYATEDLHVYQPTLLRVRGDKEPQECTIDQLTPVNKEIIRI